MNLFDDVEINADYYSMSLLVKRKSEDIFSAMKSSDIIFMNDTIFYENFLSKENLWHKTIFYDYRDNTNLVPIPSKTIYFKRSLFDRHRNKIQHNRTIRPISHCALKEYFQSSEKKYQIGCFFDITNKNLGIRRTRILRKLMSCNFSNSLVGISTAYANKARLAIADSKFDNPFYKFLELQSSCKIIFTAQPELVDGDNRTWEALASGSLVFCEEPMIPMRHPLKDGEHCIFFNSLCDKSLCEAVEKAVYYLNHDDERITITNTARQFIKQYHMPINRVLQMMVKLL